MDNAEDFNQIEKKIEYTFRNKNLLKQVFTSKAYAQKHEDCCSYEPLLSHGNLALALIEEMTRAKKSINSEGFCNLESVPLTNNKNKKQTLRWEYSGFIKMYDLPDWLLEIEDDQIFDYKEHSFFLDSIPSSLIGAIALDSDWNINEIVKVYDKINYSQTFWDNYIGQLNDWCLRSDISSPKYTDSKIDETYATLRDEYTSSVVIKDKEFFGNGNSIYNARMKAAKEACIHFNKEIMLSVSGKPNRETAIEQLENLYNQGYIPEPDYVTERHYFDDGTYGFEVSCSVDYDDGCHTASFYTKDADEGEREVAYKMLCDILEYPYDKIEE